LVSYLTHLPRCAKIAELVVITGCSSGLGRETVKNLLATDKYHVIGAVRDVDKMEAIAEIDGFNMDNFHIMECELNSFASVHKFCDDLKDYQMAKPIDRLICNAGGASLSSSGCFISIYFMANPLTFICNVCCYPLISISTFFAVCQVER
jgi:NAD(P)-dependent dehydrogenase (short-subunit alcohol dehydrogenase family)